MSESMVVAIEMGTAIATLAAGVAIAGGAIGTGMVQAAIGSAGLGLLAERPESQGIAILFLALPETILIFGFVIAILVLLGVGIV